MASYERLSVTDRIFLGMEDHDAHMHVTGCLIFDGEPLRQPDGSVDFERVCDYVESRLHCIPRYRQRVVEMPVEGDPIWVDDARFNLRYHLRHTHLPPPGDERQLKRLIGRILSQMLDRGKPLWEMWIVDGLPRGRFAVITKVHHCMADGIGSLELMAALLTPEPTQHFEPAPRWLPRPLPDRGRLVRDAVARRLEAPIEVARGLVEAARTPRDSLERAVETARGLLEARSYMAQPSSETPINEPIGPHRRFDWLAMDLERMKEVKNRLGGTINDVALTTVTGAFGRFLEQRGIPARQQRALDFRAACPVNLRQESQVGELGNRISNLIVKLPLAERDPGRRLAQVRETMQELKSSSQLLAMGAIERIGDLTFPGLLTYFARDNVSKRSSNFVFTNVPGPPTPWYLLDSQLHEIYPVAPLLPSQAVGVALMSYCGRIYWGFNSDWDQVPDLHELVIATQESFDELCKAAASAEPGRKRTRRRSQG